MKSIMRLLWAANYRIGRRNIHRGNGTDYRRLSSVLALISGCSWNSLRASLSNRQLLHQNWFRSGLYSAFESVTTFPQWLQRKIITRRILWFGSSFLWRETSVSPFSNTMLQVSQ